MENIKRNGGVNNNAINRDEIVPIFEKLVKDTYIFIAPNTLDIIVQ